MARTHLIAPDERPLLVRRRKVRLVDVAPHHAMDARAPVGGMGAEHCQSVWQAGFVDGVRNDHTDVVAEELEVHVVVDGRCEHEATDADFAVVLGEQAVHASGLCGRQEAGISVVPGAGRVNGSAGR